MRSLRSPKKHSSKGRIDVDWGHLGFVAVLTAIVSTYWWDARQTSTKISNLIFVQPLAVILICLAAIIVFQTFRRRKDGPTEQVVEDAPNREVLVKISRSALLSASFLAFILGIIYIGFDVSMLLFISLGLFLCGERSPIALIVYPILSTAAILGGFSLLVPYPLDTLIW